MTPKTSSMRWGCLSLVLVLVLACEAEQDDASTSNSTGPGGGQGPLGRTCSLPTSDVHVVDITGVDTDHVYALMSDGTARFWGGGYPLLDYHVAPEGDEPCLTSLDVAGANALGMSYERSITLIRGDEPFFGFDAWPLTLELDEQSVPFEVHAGREFVALDSTGGLWVLEKYLPAVENDGPFDRFQLQSLPAGVMSVTGNHGYCALLVDGRVYCVDPLPDGWGRFGMGLDLTAAEPTQLPVEGAAEFVLGGAGSCWLDAAGTVSCAGSVAVTGFPQQTFADYRRPSFAPVPGAPPLVHLELAYAGVCGFTSEGELWCWGETYDYVQEPEVLGFFPGWKDLVIAYRSVCVLDSTSHVHCLGRNSLGEYSCEDDPYELDVFHRIAIPDCED